MITLKSCPNCNTLIIPEYQIVNGGSVATEIMPGVKVNAVITVRYCICQNCRIIFQNPRLTDKELDRFYSQNYYRKSINLTSKEIDKDELNRAEFDAEIIKKHVGKVKSHLDIGGSRGYLLNKIGAQDKVIVEPNVKYPKVKDLKFYKDINNVPTQLFDLVTVIHTLEHVSRPFDYLKKMFKLLKKGGYLVVEVPTWKSPGGPLRLSHLYHFDPSVLRHMCIELGLKIEHEEFTPHLLLICKK